MAAWSEQQPRQASPSDRLQLARGLILLTANDYDDHFDFVIFLDESGTHSSSAMTLVGAVEVGNQDLIETSMARLKQRSMASDYLWQGDEAKRSAFAVRGFHYTEDAASVQAALVSAFSELPFRASVYFSRRSFDLETTDLLIVMFSVMVRNYAQKHHGRRVAYVFEENQDLNAIFAKIVAAAVEEVEDTEGTHEAYIGTKPLAGLSLVDYVLGITGARLSAYFQDGSKAHQYKIAQYDALVHRMSHVLDFDAGVHRSKYREIIFKRAPSGPSTFGSE